MKALLVAVSLALASPAALAFEPTGNSIADAYLRAYEGSDTTISAVSDVTATGDTVTIGSMTLDFKFTEPGTDPVTMPVVLSDTVLKNPRMDGDTLLADQLEIASMTGSLENGTYKMNFGKVVTKDLRLSDGVWGSEADWIANAASYSQTTLDGLSLDVHGQTMLTIDTVTANSAVEGTTGYKQSFAVSGVRVTPDAMALAGGAGALPVDFTKHPVDIKIAADGDVSTGDASLDPFSITMNDMGALSFAATMSGFTQATFQAAMQPNLTDDQIMEVLKPIGVDDMSISLSDSGMVATLLDFGGKQMNLSADGAKAMVANTAAGALMGLGDPKFSGELSTALKSFLEGGETLTVSADPAKPITIGEMMQLGPQALTGLPKTLNLSAQSTPN